MRKTLALAAIAAALILLSINLWSGKRSPEPDKSTGQLEARETESRETAPQEAATSAAGEEPVTTSAAAPAPEDSPDLSEEIPSREELREEVTADPHGAPTSLLRFAAEAEDKTEAALGSESESTRLFGEFEDCIMAPKSETTEATQAVCLDQARTLSERYPALERRYRELQDKANPDVVQLMQITE